MTPILGNPGAAAIAAAGWTGACRAHATARKVSMIC